MIMVNRLLLVTYTAEEWEHVWATGTDHELSGNRIMSAVGSGKLLAGKRSGCSLTL